MRNSRFKAISRKVASAKKAPPSSSPPPGKKPRNSLVQHTLTQIYPRHSKYDSESASEEDEEDPWNSSTSPDEVASNRVVLMNSWMDANDVIELSSDDDDDDNSAADDSSKNVDSK